MLPKLQRTNQSAVDPHGSSTTSLVIDGRATVELRVNVWEHPEQSSWGILRQSSCEQARAFEQCASVAGYCRTANQGPESPWGNDWSGSPRADRVCCVQANERLLRLREGFARIGSKGDGRLDHRNGLAAAKHRGVT